MTAEAANLISNSIYLAMIIAGSGMIIGGIAGFLIGKQ